MRDAVSGSQLGAGALVDERLGDDVRVTWRERAAQATVVVPFEEAARDAHPSRRSTAYLAFVVSDLGVVRVTTDDLIVTPIAPSRAIAAFDNARRDVPIMLARLRRRAALLFEHRRRSW